MNAKRLHSYRLPTVALASCLVAHCSLTSAAGDVSFNDDKQGEIAVEIDGRRAALYVYEDAEISRPYFAHLTPPDGPQVSRNHPPIPGKDRADHPEFHPGLWMSFGDISGNDYWRLKASVEQVSHKIDAAKNRVTVENRYLDQENPDETVCKETAHYTFRPRPTGYLLIWDSTFSSDKPFYFGDQEEMGIGFRVATPIRVEKDAAGQMPAGNGQMVDSEGRVNGDEIWGNAADWCSYSGELDGKHVGMAIFAHPDNFRPSWFHARDYGLLEANPFGREAFGKGDASRVPVKPGESLQLRYGILVYASDSPEKPSMEKEYENYLKASRK